MNGYSAAAVASEEAATVLLRFAGEMFEPLPSGGLYWPARRTLLVADLHFEKFSSYARRGQLLPPYDTAMTLQRLEADIARTGAAEVIALGDSFHRDEGVASLLDADRLRLAALLGRTRWTWLSRPETQRPPTWRCWAPPPPSSAAARRSGTERWRPASRKSIWR